MDFSGSGGNSYTSVGYNLIGDGNATDAFNQEGDQTNVSARQAFGADTPQLADNGGPTQTIALQAGSIAVDRIPSGTNGCGEEIQTDQRGVQRAALGAGGEEICDTGAFEARLIAQYDSYSTGEDQELNVEAPGVLDNDGTSGDGPLEAVLEQGPSNGTLDLNSDGSFIYTPNAGFTGEDTFTYKANDGSADSNVATTTIDVRSVNDPPDAQNDSAATDENTALNVNVLANDTDPDGDALTVSDASDPAHGTATPDPDGTIRYAPDPGYSGSDSFSYTVSDGEGGADTATVNVTVRDTTAPAAPAALDLVASSDTGASNTDNVTNNVRPTISGNAEAGSKVSVYDGARLLGTVTANATSGAWSFVPPTALANGVHPIKATATDAAGNVSDASAELRVTIDTVKPILSATAPTTPAKGATGVARGTNVRATFAEKMDAKTLTNPTTFASTTVKLVKAGTTTAIKAKVTVSTDGKIVMMDPSAKLAAKTKYTATITTGAGDAAGNPMAASYSWSFTTGVK